MKNIPLVEGLSQYIKEDNAPFSMPGHKYGRGFDLSSLKTNLREVMVCGDITEVDGLDNLHKPEGIIKEALFRLKLLYGSEKSYFLVNGSTSGNLIMLFSCFEEGDKVLVERNCHRSIFNGIIMRKLDPIYLKSKISEKIMAPVSIDTEHFFSMLEEHEDIKGIVITYPNYYGITSDLKLIIRECRKRGIRVLVDCAHGAHFGIHKDLPESPLVLGADMVVMSAHKTLPSLTQTAYLHVNNKDFIEKADFYSGVFLSTSPSYMLMASLDYARAFLEYKGYNSYDKLLLKIKEIKEKINSLSYVKAVDKKYLKDDIKKYNIDIDESRIVLNLKNGLSGHKLLEYLRRCKVQAEMSDEHNVVLICSPFNNEEDYDKLIYALTKIDEEIIKEKTKPIYNCSLPEKIIAPFEVFNKPKETVDLYMADGRICGENIIPYPPGIPLVMMGEKIEKEHIDIINHYIKYGVTVIGIENNKIKIVKDT